MENPAPLLASEPDPAPAPALPEPEPAVWLIEVPSMGYAWFTRDRSRVLFWRTRKDAVVTAYVKSTSC